MSARGETFEGRECHRCGSTIRYVATKRCRDCARKWCTSAYQTSTERKAQVGNRCQICDRVLVLPHYDEVDGAFRGWLCMHCNLILGHAYDDPEILERAAAYLRRNTVALPIQV